MNLGSVLSRERLPLPEIYMTLTRVLRLLGDDFVEISEFALAVESDPTPRWTRSASVGEPWALRGSLYTADTIVYLTLRGWILTQHAEVDQRGIELPASLG
jgi:hypothetical protein